LTLNSKLQISDSKKKKKRRRRRKKEKRKSDKVGLGFERFSRTAEIHQSPIGSPLARIAYLAKFHPYNISWSAPACICVDDPYLVHALPSKDHSTRHFLV
jgi:hypothetical protein